jgi:hypothetical protein
LKRDSDILTEWRRATWRMERTLFEFEVWSLKFEVQDRMSKDDG